MQILWAPAHLAQKPTQVSQGDTSFSASGHCALEAAAMWEMSNGQSEVSGRRQFLPCIAEPAVQHIPRWVWHVWAVPGSVNHSLPSSNAGGRKGCSYSYQTAGFSTVLVTQLWKVYPVWLSWSEIQIPPHADLETAPFAYSERFLCQWSQQLYASWWLKLF